MIAACFHEKIGADRQPIRVLIAEDEFLLRLDAADNMRRRGWEVVEVSSADEALELLHYSVQFDLLVTDLDMPGQADGVDLARYMRSRHPQAKVAVMTGDGQSLAADDEPYDLLLTKPVWNIAERLADLMEDRHDAG